MTTGEMIEKIYNATAKDGPKATLVGSIAGNGTVDISSNYSDYSKLENSDFIVSITSINNFSGGVGSNGGVAGQTLSGEGFSPSISLNKETGILTLSGLVQTVAVRAWNGPTANYVQTATANIYVNK